jgi:hypothetical protein
MLSTSASARIPPTPIDRLRQSPPRTNAHDGRKLPSAASLALLALPRALGAALSGVVVAHSVGRSPAWVFGGHPVAHASGHGMPRHASCSVRALVSRRPGQAYGSAAWHS